MNLVLLTLKSYEQIRCPFFLSKRINLIWKSCKAKTLFRYNRTLSSSKNIGIRNRRFDCSTAFACWMLKQLPQYQDANILRLNDLRQIDSCDVVVGIGGVYNPEKNRYDYHQRTFNGTMSSLAGLKGNTKLSSCGLVYLHIGRNVISELIELPLDDIKMEVLFEAIYSVLIEEVDAVSNKIRQFDGLSRYQVSTTLTTRVARLNPSWNDMNPDYETTFLKAMEICGDEFKERLIYLNESWLPARLIVEEAIKERRSVDSSGEIIALKSGCPWEDHLFYIEKELDIVGQIKFVLYKDRFWKVHAVRKLPGMFDRRCDLLQGWCGLHDDDLSEVSGIPNCLFVHKNGFIGGNRHMSGALEMARVALRSEVGRLVSNY